LRADNRQEVALSIRNLATHRSHYVTVSELAEYWSVSRHQIYKQILAGALAGIRLGPRLYRVPTSAAAAFERAMSVATDDNEGHDSHQRARQRLPEQFGVRRIRARSRF
jgi:excisionase family DNA binding protein